MKGHLTSLYKRQVKQIVWTDGFFPTIVSNLFDFADNMYLSPYYAFCFANHFKIERFVSSGFSC